MTRNADMQHRFGARVHVTPPTISDRQLFLVLGTSSTRLEGLIAGLGGKPLLRGPAWMLTEMGLASAMSLRGTPGVRMVGGVSINPDRLEFIHSLLTRNQNR